MRFITGNHSDIIRPDSKRSPSSNQQAEEQRRSPLNSKRTEGNSSLQPLHKKARALKKARTEGGFTSVSSVEE